jgi:hypothetical protein
MSVYVEILVRAPMESVWDHTQTPALHERWDLRFSRIDYLPKRDQSEPQRFRYETRIGFGLDVSGEGESANGVVHSSRSRINGFTDNARCAGIHVPSSPRNEMAM